MQRILVTGGVRSGKSRYAESLLAEQPRVTYVAAGPPADPDADPDWAIRVAAHQRLRPSHWRTVETPDVAAALTDADGPVLVDCLGTWLTRWLDDHDAWNRPQDDWQRDFDAELTRVLDAWRSTPGPAIAVTNEVGWGVVPAYASGRLFADLLGLTNQVIASASDRVVLMVAGRPVDV